MAVKYFQTFRPSSQYEAAAAEAERRQALAEALQQQSFQPIQVNPAGPMSYTQGLAKILQSYAAGREEKKAKEAQRKAASEIERDVAGVERTGQQLRESIESGRKPLTAAETTPDESGLAMVRGPLDPVRLASSKYGREALVNDPELLEAYKAARIKPKLPGLTSEQLMGLTPESRKLAQDAILRGESVDYGSLKKAPEIPKPMSEYEKGQLENARRRNEILGQRITMQAQNAKTGKALSPTVQKEVFETDENIMATQTGIDLLGQAAKLSDKAFEGPGANARAKAASVLPDSMEPAGTKETLEFDLLLQQQILPQLKSIFGSNPTEGERAIILDLQGSSSLPIKTRNNLIARAQQAAQRRLQFNQQKARQLREGSYFSAEGMQPTLPPDFDLDQ